MVIAVAGAALLGDWFEAASVVWLFGVAQWLEAQEPRAGAARDPRARDAGADDGARAPRRTSSAIVPRRRRRARRHRHRPAGRAMPVDGVVVAGESAVDQSRRHRRVHGRSEKAPGDASSPGRSTARRPRNRRRAAPRPTARWPASSAWSSTRSRAGRRCRRSSIDSRACYTPAVVVLALAVAFVPPLVGGWAAWGACVRDVDAIARSRCSSSRARARW